MVGMKSKDIKDTKIRIYSTLKDITEFYHFAPLDGQMKDKEFPKNLVMMTLSYLVDGNHLLVGEPGWGKTTAAKIIATKFSGLPYDLFDSLEIRGNPQKYEEKIVGRPNYGSLAKGQEQVIWQGTFGLDAIVIDEVNRLPYETQDVILQGIETGHWIYLNESLPESKKPLFATLNPKENENGLIPALNDRFDIITEEKFFSTLPVFGFASAKKRVKEELSNATYTQKVLDAIKENYTKFKDTLQARVIPGYITPAEKMHILEEISNIPQDNEAILFLQSFMAEVNYSEKYGVKRAADPISDDTHDKTYAGVNVKFSFSPRSAMSTLDMYAKGLAWFLCDEKVTLDHVRFVLPHVFAHKANFTDDYKNKHGNDIRQDCEKIHLAIQLVEEVYTRYVKSVQPMRNLIADIQQNKIGDKELQKLNVKDYDHPLMKDFITQAKAGKKSAFYEKVLVDKN